MSDWAHLGAMVESIETAPDTDTLLQRVYDSSTQFGFSHNSIVRHRHLPSGQANLEMISNYPDHWVDLTAEANGVLSDLVLAAFQRGGHALAWDRVREMMPLDARQRAILDRMFDAGFASGCTIINHMPGQPTISVDFVLPGNEPLTPASFLPAQLIGVAAGLRARELWQGKSWTESIDGRNRLSPRQIECIKIVAQGKTSWEIATLLGISEQTVTEYLNDARRRLDVSTRAQLVLKALQQGYFTLDDVVE